MEEFDYKNVPGNFLEEKELKKLGKEGWRPKLVYTDSKTGEQRAIFERKLPKEIV